MGKMQLVVSRVQDLNQSQKKTKITSTLELYHVSPIPLSMLKNVAAAFSTKIVKSTRLSILQVGVGENFLRAPAFLSGVVALESKPAINSECSTVQNIIIRC